MTTTPPCGALTFTSTNQLTTLTTSTLLKTGRPETSTPPLLSLTSRFSDSLFGSLGHSYSDDYFELDEFFEKNPLLTADLDCGNFCSVYLTRLGNFDAVPSAFSFGTLRVEFWGAPDDLDAEFTEGVASDCVTSELEERLGVPVKVPTKFFPLQSGAWEALVRLSCPVVANPEQGTANLVGSVPEVVF